MSSCPCSSPDSERPLTPSPYPLPFRGRGIKSEGANPLKGLIKEALSKLTKDKRLTEEGVRAAWGKAAGRKAASHSAPVSLRRSTLIVNVDNSGWLYELTMKKRKILQKIKTELAGKKINQIRFRVGEIK